MQKLHHLIASFNNSVLQRKMIFRAPNTSINYRVLRSLWRLNYLTAVTRDGFELVASHRLDNAGNPLIRKMRPLYSKSGRKYTAAGRLLIKKMSYDRSGNILLLTAGAESGLIWAHEANECGVGGTLLLQIYF